MYISANYFYFYVHIIAKHISFTYISCHLPESERVCFFSYEKVHITLSNMFINNNNKIITIGFDKRGKREMGGGDTGFGYKRRIKGRECKGNRLGNNE